MLGIREISLGGKTVRVSEIEGALKRDLPDYTCTYEFKAGNDILRVHVDRVSGIDVTVLSGRIVLTKFVTPWLLTGVIWLFIGPLLRGAEDAVAACIEKYLSACDRGEYGQKECTQCEASYADGLTECPECGYSGFVAKDHVT